MIRIVVAVCVIACARSFPQRHERRSVNEESDQCGYDHCPESVPGMLNVHLVPHTHDDVGWLKTVDQYYYGSRTNIQNAGVQYILDSVVNELLHDPNKKFIYVETAFFWKWWKEQEDHMRHRVKQLVKKGQLEFIGGAWSMNDEATTHYQSVVDQFTWGFRKLNDTFGYCGQPKIGWQIDPFGHSRETASMMAQFGFDGLFFGRLDYQDKRSRANATKMEMIWESNPSLGLSGDLLTSALYNFYSAPDGFCFDILCDDDPIIDDPSSREFNLDRKLDDFLKFSQKQATYFKTENIIMTFGMDFNYQFAHKNFKNMDKLISQCTTPSLEIEVWTHSMILAIISHSRGMNFDLSHKLTGQDPRPTTDIFAGALHNLYQAPKNFCFDIMCGDEPIIDDIHSPDYNVDKRVNEFLGAVYMQWADYERPEIMMTMGGDFNYQDAHYYFKNLDKLIRYINARKSKTGVNVFYSTPACYIKSLHDLNKTWPTKQDDFFPYASDPHAYWTGYFTSRPTLKYFERQGNNHLQICKQLSSLARLGPEDNPDIDALREAMGIMQHHDAITGTEKQHVADDYARILTEALKKCEIVSNAGLNKLMSSENPSLPPLTFTSCLLSNISECKISTNTQKFMATVYNPLSRPVNFIVRLPVYGRSYTIRNPQGGKIPNQVVPIPQSLVNIPGRATRASLELVFRAEAVPPLGYRSYYISEVNSNSTETLSEEESFDDAEEYVIGDNNTQLTFNASTGLLSSAVFQGKRIQFSQSLEYYVGHSGHNDKFRNRASGAYIFRPKDNHSTQITGKVNATMYKGPIVTEVHQDFTSWASQVTRQYNGDPTVEIEWMVGPIPIDDLEGKEIISRFKTDLNSEGKFYTDSNGRQTIERKRNFRPTWNLDLKEPVAGNYYPVTTDISINNKDLELTVLTDRAQGGSSLRDGEIELMLHRRLLYDDGFGVGEALNEESYGEGLIARGRHWINVGQISDPDRPKQKSLLRQEKVLSPQVVLTNATLLRFEDLVKSYKLEYSGLSSPLPPEVQILTLEPWKERTYLLRLEHLLEKSESQPVTVNLGNLFSAFDIVSIRETSLGGNRWLDEVSRFIWKKESNEINYENDSAEPTDAHFPQVVLKPKQIRTFVCDIKPKKAI